jgi:hypothetical protein
MNFLISNVPMVIFFKIEKYFFRIVHTLCGSLFHAFTQNDLENFENNIFWEIF